MLIRLLLSGALLASSATAQEKVSPSVFLDAVVGRTLTFRANNSGNLVGKEQFLRRDLSVWTDVSGRCTYGRILVREEKICFLYEDAPDPDNCWLIFRYEGTFFVMSERLEIQEITSMDRTPLSCEGAPLS